MVLLAFTSLTVYAGIPVCPQSHFLSDGECALRRSQWQRPMNSEQVLQSPFLGMLKDGRTLYIDHTTTDRNVCNALFLIEGQR